jgi:hypothetical protein
MDVHNIGGLRRVQKWEVADIAIVVFVIRRNSIVARKIALLQAKRLYPENNDVQEDDPVGFAYGLNAFLRSEESPSSMALARRFDFVDGCIYGALQAQSDQVRQIDYFSAQFGPVDYLLYNPPSVPMTVTFPLAVRQTVKRHPPVGCRVVPAKAMHRLLAKMTAGQSPTFLQVCNAARPRCGWRVEEYAADLLLTCKVGRPFDATDDGLVLPIIERRGGPIGAAIAVSVELPEN